MVRRAEAVSPEFLPELRIAAYQVDDKSGNTAANLALGIFVIIIRVQSLATADFIVLQAEVGTNVSITAQV